MNRDLKTGGSGPGAYLALAPMAGVTDRAFRAICREQSRLLTYTEMVSSRGLVHGDKKSMDLCRLDLGDHPSAVQLFGSDPACMAEAAAIAVAEVHPDFIDINMGCPTPKIVSNGDGCALMRDTDKAVRVARAVVAAAAVPVTVKCRLGWDRGNINVVEFARMLESSGIAAICVHGRTRAQMYAGRADWDTIAQVKQAVGIPVTANGDIFTPGDATRAMRTTGADMLMVGRAAFGNPWIFGQIGAALSGLPPPALPPLKERILTAMRQIQKSADYKGEHIACLEARRHLAWYLRGVAHSGYYKRLISHLSSLSELDEISAGIIRDLD